MYVYALFDNETAELVVIKFLHAAVDKLLDIYLHSFQSPKVQESAKRGILCAYEVIFSEDIKRYYQTSPISVTLKDFNQHVDGSSAGLAYAVALAAALKDRKVINPPYPMPDKIAATGELDNLGNVVRIKNLKQKITAAINEKVILMLYPSQNYDELNFLRQSDYAFDNAIKESGIALKHVSTLKQAFCELGIFQTPSISIDPIKSSVANRLTVAVSLNNDIFMEIKSFSLFIKFDKHLQIEKSAESNLCKNNRHVNYTINKENNLLLSFNTDNDKSIVLNESTKLLEISFMPIDSIVEKNKYEFEFEEKNCTINFENYEGIGGIILKSSTLLVNENFCLTQFSESNKAVNFIKNHKKSFVLSGILLSFLLALVYASSITKNNEIAVYDATVSPTPAITFTLYSPKISPPVEVEASILPTPLVVADVANLPTPIVTISPISTPTPETLTTPPSVNISTPTMESLVIPTTLPNLADLYLNSVDDFTTWKKKDINSTSRLSSEEGYSTAKVVRLDYTIKGDGSVFIKTKPDVVNISPNKYKKLSFYYKCISEESLLDTVNIKIHSSNHSKTFDIGTTQELSTKGQWSKKEIDISNIEEITSLELFIGCLPINGSNDALNKGSFFLCNFKLSP